MEANGGDGFFTELDCVGCRYNQGTAEQPVCEHPKGVRMVFGARCVNRVSAQVGKLLEAQAKVKED